MPVAAGSGVPEWIHVLPSGEITTQDGRGPYRVPDMAALADALNLGAKLAVDECHSTDLAAPKGAPAPARGWMTQFEARDDGLWARVEWTGQGRALMEDQAYNGISPVIVHRKDNTVIGLLRASLTNAPNLKGLTALHSQETTDEGSTPMDWKTKLVELLKIDQDADDAAIESALKKGLEAPGATAHSQEFDITTHPSFTALQSELADVTKALNAQTETTARDKATAFVDSAIAEGRVGVKPARDTYIDMHMKDPAQAAKLIEALPILKSGTTLHSELAPSADTGGFDAGDRQVMALMGLNEDEYQASQKAAGQRKEAL